MLHLCLPSHVSHSYTVVIVVFALNTSASQQSRMTFPSPLEGQMVQPHKPHLSDLWWIHLILQPTAQGFIVSRQRAASSASTVEASPICSSHRPPNRKEGNRGCRLSASPSKFCSQILKLGSPPGRRKIKSKQSSSETNPKPMQSSHQPGMRREISTALVCHVRSITPDLCTGGGRCKLRLCL